MNDASFTRRPRHFLCSLLRVSSSAKTGLALSFALLVATTSCHPLAHAAAVPGTISGESETPDTSTNAPAAARAVRLSFVEGSVRVTQGDQVIADPAVVNMPLFEGTEITTATDGRAEVQLEDGSVVRLSPNTTLDFTLMQAQGSATRTEATLRGGLAYFEVQTANNHDLFRIRYDDASVTASEPSIIRLTHDAPPAELAVLSGNVRLLRSGAQPVDVHGGQSFTFDATDLSRSNLASSIQPNSWDNWNADRDQLLGSEAADQTSATANQDAGYAGGGTGDLDANGNWYDVPDEGYVWAPYEAQDAGEGWDPYGYGNWVDYPQYGYVWVSGYSWGYSPFACGLWNYYPEFGWGWAPGGGCNPWWGYGGGGRGWLYRLGNQRPPGYRPPHRPPHRPVPFHNGGSTLRAGNQQPVNAHRVTGNPIIPVDHRPGGGGAIPVSRDGGQVYIAGHSVEPLHPIGGARQGFHASDSDNGSTDNSNENQGFVTSSRGQSGNPGSHARPTYAPTEHPGYRGGVIQSPTNPRPEPVRPIPSRPVTAPPAPRYSPPPAPHYSPPPVYHPSPPPASHPHH